MSLPLLASSTHDGLYPDSRSSSDVEGSHPLRPIQLVATDGHQVHCHGIHIHWNLPHCLWGGREGWLVAAGGAGIT